jgi:hypothetical protein
MCFPSKIAQWLPMLMRQYDENQSVFLGTNATPKRYPQLWLCSILLAKQTQSALIRTAQQFHKHHGVRCGSDAYRTCVPVASS